jgi:hypothetical protein
MRHTRMLTCSLAALVVLIVGVTSPEAWAAKKKLELEISRIYWEYNSSANDLGVHVSLDGEDWRKLKIINPAGRTIFEVEGRGPYRLLGLTELFFEGAEPNLDDFPLENLLARFPEGTYRFTGRTVDGDVIAGTGQFTHAIPAGPTNVVAALNGNSLVISWNPVTGPPDGFPDLPIAIVGYQVIVGSFQVTIPATTTPLQVTVPPEFVASLPGGENLFEVLAIEAGGNQTITEGAFKTAK